MGSVLSKPVSFQRVILHDFTYTATCGKAKRWNKTRRFITAKIIIWKTVKRAKYPKWCNHVSIAK